MSENQKLLAIVFALLLVIGLYLGLTWLVVVVAWGFGYTLPFWPTLGVVFLTMIVLNQLRRST